MYDRRQQLQRKCQIQLAWGTKEFNGWVQLSPAFQVASSGCFSFSRVKPYSDAHIAQEEPL